MLEGAVIVGSEVFEVPTCATQAIRNLCPIETTPVIWQGNCKWTKVAKLKTFGSDRV